MGKVKNQFKTAIKPYSLDRQILESRFAKRSTRIKVRNHQEVTEEKFVDDRSTKKILLQARQQQEDLEDEFGLNVSLGIFQGSENANINLSTIEENDTAPSYSINNDLLEEFQITEDESDLKTFLIPKDIIIEKLTEKKTEIQTIFSDAGGLRPEVLEACTPIFRKVGHLLSTYCSGKIPKQFKFLPRLPGWEQLLNLTEPDHWTAAAMYQATRIFASNLRDNMAAKFYKGILLPRLRDDIAECKVLNHHLYSALKKALYKPSAFFRGIIIPLCESDSCTLREATIIANVFPKVSIPVFHSSAALFRISEMDFTGPRSIFMRKLLEKKYDLPFRVIDNVVLHFLRYKDVKEELPVLWHQCLKIFVEIYKAHLSIEQQREMICLLTKQVHPSITPEIRRELIGGRS